MATIVRVTFVNSKGKTEKSFVILMHYRYNCLTEIIREIRLKRDEIYTRDEGINVKPYGADRGGE